MVVSMSCSTVPREDGVLHPVADLLPGSIRGHPQDRGPAVAAPDAHDVVVVGHAVELHLLCLDLDPDVAVQDRRPEQLRDRRVRTPLEGAGFDDGPVADRRIGDRRARQAGEDGEGEGCGGKKAGGARGHENPFPGTAGDDTGASPSPLLTSRAGKKLAAPEN